MVNILDILKELTEANGAPGYEGHIRSIMRRVIEDNGAQLINDHMGSILKSFPIQQSNL